jgi:hypothetical protein
MPTNPQQSEAEKLIEQRNLALVHLYLHNPQEAAALCDEEFDPTGILLGEIRALSKIVAHTLLRARAQSKDQANAG